MSKLRIATWNVARPKPGSARTKELQSHMEAIDADIWVITEAHTDLAPTAGHELVARSTRENGTSEGECWVAIWSKTPGTQVGTVDGERTAAAVIPWISGRRLVIYGTVLPWIGSAWRDHPAANGQAFGASLAQQLVEWKRFASTGHLCVAGDLNQDLLTSGHYYGSTKNRAALRDALDAAGLTCVTALPTDVVHDHTGGERAGIDHVCVSRGLAPMKGSMKVWPGVEERSSKLSDHFGVSVMVTPS